MQNQTTYTDDTDGEDAPTGMDTQMKIPLEVLN